MTLAHNKHIYLSICMCILFQAYAVLTSFCSVHKNILLSVLDFRGNINLGITCKPLLYQASSKHESVLDKRTI